ncbi:hypothetical protein Mesil_1906 [Allomeiothermus silvanus DSM 9946]|uniref:Uncharacterized protein n=1 Tax=Allomeiothermus silvanus (strain ATCC 700542 / DSM 9946 / NBRC 106475 / NCIMB 13440 / VI-R2) TaxID=526227 RepID=D7BGG5_ALLS1|nr:hypothetical protein [Allomeiothermus silvanus]ADH63781.1 hypothetical protein Mesil_1906 [Allomeiothermus silvanus DSM 9946]
MAGNLERWRAEHTAKYLWWVAHGVRGWQSDRISYAPETDRLAARPKQPGYLVIQVMALPEIGIDRHTLRLWRSDYQALLDRTDPAIKDEWAAFLHRARWSSLWYFDARNRRIRPGNEHRGLTAWTLELGRLAEVLPGGKPATQQNI